MATDLERLVVQLSADVRQYDNAMKKALGATQKQTRAIESRFSKMNTGIASSAGALARRLVVIYAATKSVQSLTKFSDAATRIDNALKVAGLSGAELEKVYARLRQSAVNNAAPIEALVELYGRASQVQKELGISSEQLLGFTDKIALALRVSGKSAAESSGALLQLSQLLGAGTVRAEEFNSVQEGALPILQAVAAGIEEAGGSVAKLRKLVIDGKLSSEAFFRGFEAGAVTLEQKVATSTLTFSQAMGNLETALIDTAREFNASTGASEKFAKGINNAAQAISDFDVSGFVRKISEAGGAVDKFLNDVGNSSFFEKLAELALGTELTVGKPISLETLEAEKKLDGLKYQIDILTQLIEHNKEMSIDTTGARAELADLLKQAAAVQATIGGGGRSSELRVPGTPSDPNAVQYLTPPKTTPTVKTIKAAAYAPPGDGKGKKKRENEFQREMAQIKERTAALQAETAAQSGLNPLVNDYGFAVEKARAVQELLNAAQQAGLIKTAELSAATPALRAQIESLATGYATAAVEAEKLAERQDKVRERAEEFAGLAKDTLGGFISDLRNGVSAADALNNALSRIADTLINQVLDAIFKIDGTGFLSTLFGGGIALPGTAPIPTPRPMAGGGPVHGAGTGTSDSIPARLSNGEYVVNARATAKHRGLLDAINNGRGVMRLAAGGYVGMAIPRLGSKSGGSGAPIVNIIDNAGVQKQTSSRKGPDERQIIDIVLNRVGEEMAGGRYDTPMTRYGARPTTVRR